MKIKHPIFISNTNILEARGGWDGLGWKIFSELKKRYPELTQLQKVNPAIKLVPKIWSKLLRTVGLPGPFPIFNSRRLKQINGILHDLIPVNSDYIIFHGATPWVAYSGNLRYCAFLDCSFMTYMQYYHNIDEFSKSDIERIMMAERSFFQKAHRIFFSSQWAIEEARRIYNIEGSNFYRIGQGPTTKSIQQIPVLDREVKDQFLFIGLDFLGKGGAEVYQAFERLLTIFPNYKLVIAGQKPPDEFLLNPSVDYKGFINKSVPEELLQLEALFRESKALVMMTKKDIAPVAVLEAGMQGCISIANRVTALAEMVQDNSSGFLINSDVDELYQAMVKVASLSNEELFVLRRQAQEFVKNNFTWDTAIQIMVDQIEETSTEKLEA